MAAVKKRREMLDQIPLSFVYRKQPVFQKNIKVFAVLCTMHTIWEDFEYFYVFLEYRLFPENKLNTLFDQAFYGSFLTIAILPYPVFENVYRDDNFSPESKHSANVVHFSL